MNRDSDIAQTTPKRCNSVRTIVIISIANVVLYHFPLFSFAIANLDYLSGTSVSTLLTLLVVVFSLSAFVLTLLQLISHHLIKLFCILMAFANAITFYFIMTYQVVLDKSMMGNLLNTNFAEASSYFHSKLILYIVIFGALPAWFLIKIRLSGASRLSLIAFIVSLFVFSSSWFYFSSANWLWIDKHSKKVGSLIMPWSYLVNMVRYQSSLQKMTRPQQLLPDATFNSDEKTIIVLVIGESARAKSFSLYGHKKMTNPALANAGVTVLKDTTACSTYTTASLRCILSHTDSGSEFSTPYEPLPSYLHRHGIDVIWRTNNWGEPKLNVHEYLRDSELSKNCQGEGCVHDEVLLANLEERIRASNKNKVFITLHQSGSHGPAYHSKYPARFDVFKPVCRSVELHQCSQAELINAYDNTILYTDYFLAQVISMLKSFDDTATMFLYISDHGESLGEHGLYLHGTPLIFAPDEQKKVPFILWMSPEFADQQALAQERIEKRTSHSHRNVFHTVMGGFDMTSEVYDESLDITNTN